MFSPIHIFKEHQSYLRKQLVWTWRSQTHFHYNQSTNNVDKPTILFQKKRKKNSNVNILELQRPCKSKRIINISLFELKPLHRILKVNVGS